MNLIVDTQLVHWPFRLGGSRVQRGYKNSIAAATSLFIFGVPFTGLGTYYAMIGAGYVTVDPSSVHVAYWVLTLVGAIFAFAGLACWGMALRQLLLVRKHRILAATDYGKAMKDYPWNNQEYVPSRWAPVRNGLVGFIFFAAFTAIMAYLVINKPVPWWLGLVAALLGLITFGMGYDAGVKLSRAIKFGPSRIIFDRFPYRLNHPVIIKWEPPKGLTEAHAGSFTLRCVEEHHETTGAGEDSSTSLVHTELWRSSWLLNNRQAFYPGEKVNIRYEPPDGLSGTQLSAERPIFWEFEVKLQMPGPDFYGTYLVPIYN
ncbi:MAG: hypothetical protein PHR16_04855 [Methylovulum sp.]|nr:hypothetical protein [Methylovulum sp.]